MFMRYAAMVAAVAASTATSSAGTPDGAWFQSLRQPITGASCCDIADCKITSAEWRQNKPPALAGISGSSPEPEWQWWAEVQGQWTAIPRDKELKKQSPDGEAYVCSGYGRRIYCFIPPNLGF